ncbi:MAG: hypothetical protein COB39_07455 [Marinosulfonomonas sp.]|nr:MAG: hypothetical protein COB39_07455 [Marinosulfonomonas sp.]
MTTTRPKLAFVSPYEHFGAMSGARKRIENLCIALSDDNVKVSCLSPWKIDADVDHIPYSLEGNFFVKFWNVLRLNWLLWRLKPEVVISESPFAPLPFGRYRLFHMIHDAKFVTAHGRSKRKIARMVHWVSARISDGLITVSLSEKNRLLEALHLPVDHILVSYNGVSSAWLEMDRTDRTPLCYDLIFVSNFARHKGHINLLRAIRGTSFSVVFVGADFGEREQCKKAAIDWSLDVTFMQDLSEEELIRIYDQSRVFVFPSNLEGFGMPYLEARARGLPVVANDIPVFNELQQIVGGHIVDFSNSDQVRSRLMEAMMLTKEVPDLDVFKWSEIATDLLMETRK